MRRPATVALAVVLLACATNPVTGRRELVFMSAEREAALGREAAKQVEQEMGLVEAPALVAYVRELGALVAAQSPRRDVPFQFFVANMKETNAFALPGGYIYVSRGLLALTRSEGELANVLAHEIGHVAARHAAQRETRAVGVGLLTVLGTVAAAAVGGAPAAQSVAQLGQLAGAGLIAGYNRDQERQADQVGQQMAARAGFDPGGMASFLEALDRETTLELGEPRRPTFLDSHPATPERFATAAAFARELGTRGPLPPPRERSAFVARLDGLLVDEDPAEGVIRDGTFLHPDLDLHVAFPDGWKVQNGRAAVGASEPQGGAVVVLQGQEAGSDPRAAASRFLSANAQAVQVLDHEPVRDARVPAYRARAQVALQGGTAVADFFWLAHRGQVYRLDALAAAADFSRYARAFERTANSFRPLASEERAGISERRLHVATARDGERLEDLAERTGNVWRIEQVALANALSPGERLSAGQRVKVAVERPYRGRASTEER